MSSRPKEQRLLKALQGLATAELGDGAEPIDLVVSRVAGGQTITGFAKDAAAAMGEEASRSWISWISNRLTADAKLRIAAARNDGRRTQLAKNAGRTAGQNDDNIRRLRGAVPAPR